MLPPRIRDVEGLRSGDEYLGNEPDCREHEGISLVAPIIAAGLLPNLCLRAWSITKSAIGVSSESGVNCEAREGLTLYERDSSLTA